MGDQARATNHIMLGIPPEQTAPPLPLSRAPYTRETISKQLYKVPVPNRVDVTSVVERVNRSFKIIPFLVCSFARPQESGSDKQNQSYHTHLVLVNAIKLKVNTFVTTNQF
jgi:hypothetical protein